MLPLTAPQSNLNGVKISTVANLTKGWVGLMSAFVYLQTLIPRESKMATSLATIIVLILPLQEKMQHRLTDFVKVKYIYIYIIEH